MNVSRDFGDDSPRTNRALPTGSQVEGDSLDQFLNENHTSRVSQRAKRLRHPDFELALAELGGPNYR